MPYIKIIVMCSTNVAKTDFIIAETKQKTVSYWIMVEYVRLLMWFTPNHPIGSEILNNAFVLREYDIAIQVSG